MIKLNYNNILYDLLPVSTRNIVNFQWGQVLFTGIKSVWDTFYQYTLDNDYEIVHQSQVLLFEQYLNFHVPSNSGVTIGDGDWIDYTYFYNQSEIDQPTEYIYFYNESEYAADTGLTYNYLYNESEYAADSYDFTVIYNALEPNADIEDDLTIWVEKLRLASTTYIYETV